MKEFESRYFSRDLSPVYVNKKIIERFVYSWLTFSLPFNISEVTLESQIVATFQSSEQSNGPSNKLVDGGGLGGIYGYG